MQIPKDKNFPVFRASKPSTLPARKAAAAQALGMATVRLRNHKLGPADLRTLRQSQALMVFLHDVVMQAGAGFKDAALAYELNEFAYLFDKELDGTVNGIMNAARLRRLKLTLLTLLQDALDRLTSDEDVRNALAHSLQTETTT